MTGADGDDEFDAYLKRRSLLRDHLDGLDEPEPPDELDRIVLKKARQAIRRAPQPRLYRAPRWALPVGLAAVLLLSFAIVLNVSLRPGLQRPRVETFAQATAPNAISAPTATAPPAASTAAKAAAAPMAAPAPGNEAWRSDPAAWLRHIDALRAEGHNDAAEQELRLFRKAYPRYSPSR